MRDLALALKFETQPAAGHGDVTIAHGSQAKGFVVARIFLIAHTDERGLEQRHDRRQNFFPRQVAGGEIARAAFPQSGQFRSELKCPVIFGVVAHLAPAGMVAVLFAALLVTPCCLQMTVFAGTNP